MAAFGQTLGQVQEQETQDRFYVNRWNSTAMALLRRTLLASDKDGLKAIMSITQHIIAHKVSGQFAVTRCGLELGEYGIPVGGVVRHAVAPDSIAFIYPTADDPYESIRHIEVRCMVCWDR